MKSPFTGKEMELMYESRTWKFRGEVYEYMHASWLCADTGERFTTDETDDAGYRQVTNQYRAKYGIPYTDEIIALRCKYGLSAAKMSLILGFGVNQWRSYEDGEVPSVSNGRMIRSIADPSVFLNILNSAKHVLGESDYMKISSRIQAIIETEQKSWISEYEHDRLFMCERGVENGYGITSVEKLRSVILTVLSQCGEVFCTKMNKLLFYIDFYSYRKTGKSLTGLTYRALPYGPVPERWDRIYGCFDEIVLEPRISGDKEGIVIVPVGASTPGLLNAEDLEIISFVCTRFKDSSAADISRISHEEEAWQECNSNRLRIPYEYAFKLKAV
jgi:uncharacterized phage-associated protein